MEGAFLVAAELPAGRGAGRAARAPWGAAESLEELAQLARTAGIGGAGRLRPRPAKAHPHPQEGQIRVELAQYSSLLPRLTGLWTHLIRQGGGRAAGGYGVGLRGPGAAQPETGRRRLRAGRD